MARLVLLALIWGASFLFIELALEGLSPLQIVLGRLIAGASVILLIVGVLRRALPRGAMTWVHLSVLAVVANILPFFLFAWAQERITSGLAGVLNGTTPLFTLALAVAALSDERLSRHRLIGFLIGFIGVVLVVGPWDQNPLTSSIPGQLACLGAAFCYGCSFVYTRRFLTGRGFGPLSLAAAQLGIAALLMLAASPWLAQGAIVLTPVVVGSVVVLGGVGTGLAYLLYFRLIVDAGATSASMVTYLIPVVAVTLGVVVLDEPVSWNLFVGAAVVISGVAVADGRLGKRTPRSGSRPTVDSPPHTVPDHASSVGR